MFELINVEDTLFIMSKKSLALDELFGFSEARRRLEKKDEEPCIEPDFTPYRIFVNNIDSYCGHHFAEVF